MAYIAMLMATVGVLWATPAIFKMIQVAQACCPHPLYFPNSLNQFLLSDPSACQYTRIIPEFFAYTFTILPAYLPPGATCSQVDTDAAVAARIVLYS